MNPAPTAPGPRLPKPPGSRLPLLGWLMTGLLVAYMVLIHHGLGGTELGRIAHFWQPTGFLRENEWAEVLLDHWGLGVLVFSLPAAVALLVAAWATRSAMARTLAICSFVCVILMAFYGLSPALSVWEFFHWRASVVILVTGIALGSTLAAPFLAGRILYPAPRWPLLFYLPVFFAVASMIRNATGSDPSLYLNFSPWPAIPMLAFEVGAYTLAGLLFGLALGLVGSGLARGRRWLRALGFAAGALFPLFWFSARFGQPGFEFGSWVVLGSGFVMFLVSLTRLRPAREEHLRRAALLFLGALLVTAPLIVGRAFADADYALTRHVRAQAVIDALASYQAAEGAYPEKLPALVDGNYIDHLPDPRIGFSIFFDLGWLERPQFDYRNLGPSYVLEFSSTAWVMCSYNPPWELEEDEEEDPEDMDLLGGAWNCPDDRPDLW